MPETQEYHHPDYGTRREHVARTKAMALEIVEKGTPLDAFTCVVSMFAKHPETVNHFALELGMMQMVAGMLKTPEEMREFIEGIG